MTKATGYIHIENGCKIEILEIKRNKKKPFEKAVKLLVYLPGKPRETHLLYIGDSLDVSFDVEIKSNDDRIRSDTTESPPAIQR